MNSPVSYIALIFSAAAIVFSIFTWRDRKSQEKRELFLQLHERGHDIELQRGRRILYRIDSVEDAQALFKNKPEDYDCANKALWMLDIAALYAEQNYIDCEMFMQEWGFVYESISEHARHFINERIARSGMRSQFAWPHFQSFAIQTVDRVRRE